ncbi:metal ABC transporter permease [Plantibacter sp. VKM Ac-2880]|uniref:zinc ABC transporter permease AztB n=1 Tax=Plantibacter sp. VKM Ac-2880 TaxID=2783827 RepID=UPI00188E3BB7|nr:zinc ABC transporter permease AztB [Plantibacter sp. VKM Ac-2880]MBF4568061.1 metal ABC transporter permease [Plantibacter sp. VKM Ac-2880]
MTWITEPFTAAFLLRALVGGVLVAGICGVVGTWVVLRGLAFLGEAMAHGMLPGVATAALLGLPPVAGAAVSAVVMSAGISLVSRRGRLSHDTSIGLLFVGMLALGVIIVSSSRSFATDLTAILFGDILAIRNADLLGLAVALIVTVLVAIAFHRPFVALAFDRRVAATMGLRPRLAHAALVGLVTLAVVASYSAVGTLLVVALLLGPAVAAAHWARSIPLIMLLATGFGALAVLLGLLVSWYGDTAAGASIAACSILLAAASWAVRSLVARIRRPGSPHLEPSTDPTHLESAPCTDSPDRSSEPAPLPAPTIAAPAPRGPHSLSPRSR